MMSRNDETEQRYDLQAAVKSSTVDDKITLNTSLMYYYCYQVTSSSDFTHTHTAKLRYDHKFCQS